MEGPLQTLWLTVEPNSYNDMSVMPQTLANGIYRSVAWTLGGLISRHRIVESVYVNRSVAVGEVAFGRSDIDFIAIVRQPESESADGPELASLYKATSLQRFIGHIQIHDIHGFEKWIRTDTHRGSIVRRTAMLLWGQPASMPRVTVRPEDAVRWFAWYPAHFFSDAVRMRNLRNLHKIAAEMWNAYAVASGVIPEPEPGRKKSEACARAHPDGTGLLEVADEPGRAPDFVFTLAKKLHDSLFPVLKPLQEPVVFRSPTLFRSADRNFVIQPRAGLPWPSEAGYPLSFFATPELLHLYCHYVNPFLTWYLPDEMWLLGFLHPVHMEYVRAFAFFLQDNMLRFPGFGHKDSGTVEAMSALSRKCFPYLADGRIPPPDTAESVMALAEHPSGCYEYYKHKFGRLYWQAQEQLRFFEGLEESSTQAARRNSSGKD